jgi:guanine nucleotide-binding protein G(i) subunit alpha
MPFWTLCGREEPDSNEQIRASGEVNRSQVVPLHSSQKKSSSGSTATTTARHSNSSSSSSSSSSINGRSNSTVKLSRSNSNPTNASLSSSLTRMGSRLLSGFVANNEQKEEVPVQEYKILLLGTGESGKSTIQKQFCRRFEPDGIPEITLKHFSETIVSNVIDALGIACYRMNKTGIKYTSGEIADIADHMIALSKSDISLKVNIMDRYDEELYNKICTLWKDPVIQKVVREQVLVTHVSDSILYFLENLGQIRPPFELPTNTQIIHACKKTTGIVQTTISLENIKFIIIDTGGQRNERRKWKSMYTKADMVIFVVALSDYDQQLYEDSSINRLQDALDAFKNVVNIPELRDCPFFLIFNKVNSFKYRIEELMHDLHLCFPEYNQGRDYKAAMKFIENQFTQLFSQRGGSQNIFIEYVNAINNDELDPVLDKIKNIALESFSQDISVSNIDAEPELNNGEEF